MGQTPLETKCTKYQHSLIDKFASAPFVKWINESGPAVHEICNFNLWWYFCICAQSRTDIGYKTHFFFVIHLHRPMLHYLFSNGKKCQTVCQCVCHTSKWIIKQTKRSVCVCWLGLLCYFILLSSFSILACKHTPGQG